MCSSDLVHRTVAAAVYGIPPEEVTHTQREFSKMVSYGLAYGMEAYGLSQRLGVAVEEAAAIMESYFGAFPLVKQYMDYAVADAKVEGLTRTLFGLERDGLISRETDPVDRRRSVLAITEAGAEVLRRDMYQRDGWLAKTMAEELNPTEQEILRLAGELMERLAESGGGTEAG